MNLRAAAKEIFLETLEQLDVRRVVRQKIRCVSGRLQTQTAEYQLDRFSRFVILAVGKAAIPMAEGLMELLVPQLSSSQELEGLVVGTTLPLNADARMQYLLGSHPLPDARAYEAADTALRLLSGLDETTLVFFLVSGGASAMLERPRDSAFTQQQTAGFYAALVQSGLSIGDMNTLRKHFSAVKGGQLAVAAFPATMCTLLVSDTRPSDLDVVGSGLSLPDRSTIADCLKILGTSHLVLPPQVAQWFHSDSLPETPKPESPAFQNAAWEHLLSSDDLCAAAQKAAERRGFRALIDTACDEWDYSDAAEYLLDRAERASRQGTPLCLVSAGEIAVRVLREHGIGGRNQHFILECARRIRDTGLAVTVLSAGSDGIDGNSPAAGAVADLSTVDRAIQAGFSLRDTLNTFDSYSLLHALGDTIEIGPTGNNLRDLRLLLIA